jgi:hypothetical protein
MHTVRQQPARLITSHCQQMCAPLLPSRCTGMRRQDSSPSRAVRSTKPRPYAQLERQSAQRGAQLLGGCSRATVGTSNRIKCTSATPTASPPQHTAHHERRNHSVVFHGKYYRTGDSHLLSYRIHEGYARCLNRNTTPNQPQTNCNS